MTFYSRSFKHVSLPVTLGDGTQPIYVERVCDDGTLRLFKDGTSNLFEYVQASKDECDIYTILNRYQRGDFTALNQCQGQYIDVVGMPSNLMEARNLLIAVNNKFVALPDDVRAKFDNDVNKFVDVVVHSSSDQLNALFNVNNNENVVKDGDGDVA